MRDKVIYFDKESGKYITPWGYVKCNFATNQVEVRGPGVKDWFDADKAVKTAGLFASHCESPGMAFTLAIHQQFAAWKGAMTLTRAS